MNSMADHFATIASEKYAITPAQEREYDDIDKEIKALATAELHVFSGKVARGNLFLVPPGMCCLMAPLQGNLVSGLLRHFVDISEQTMRELTAVIDAEPNAENVQKLESFVEAIKLQRFA